MLVYRIASNEYINDLSGYGAKLNGGRWNREGVAVLYTGSSISLCAWEYWVHLPDMITMKQNAFAAATIYVPDTAVLTIEQKTLEHNRVDLPKLTDDWIQESDYLLMKVPSFVVASEFNFLLNPAHPQFTQVKVQTVTPFSFDERAFRKSLLS